MRRRQTWRWVPVSLLLAIGGTMAGRAGEFTIPSVGGTGKLTFNEVSTAKTYRVEWASAPSGPWRSFTGSAAAALDRIEAQGSGIVTCWVPMCYRVVANTRPKPGPYLVVDLSGGPTAETYDYTYLEDVPPRGWTDEYKTTKLVLRRIPATVHFFPEPIGGFTMGSPPDELGRGTDETPHTVRLTQDFYLGVFEVTQRQWELVMGNKPSFFNNATDYATRPVEHVSYCDIRENPENSEIDPNWPATNAVHEGSFMGKLRAKTGLLGFDLPTESQWEYACRAETATALNSGYNLTNTVADARMDEVGRYWYNGGSGYSQEGAATAGTALAGSYLANAWGLYDMHGNVLEWCLDRYGIYPGPVTDPKGDSSWSYRVLRGGSWCHDASRCRSAYRYDFWPAYRDYYTGFRACCAPPDPAAAP